MVVCSHPDNAQPPPKVCHKRSGVLVLKLLPEGNFSQQEGIKGVHKPDNHIPKLGRRFEAGRRLKMG
jgi:hypothetical protein